MFRKETKGSIECCPECRPLDLFQVEVVDLTIILMTPTYYFLLYHLPIHIYLYIFLSLSCMLVCHSYIYTSELVLIYVPLDLSVSLPYSITVAYNVKYVDSMIIFDV